MLVRPHDARLARIHRRARRALAEVVHHHLHALDPRQIERAGMVDGPPRSTALGWAQEDAILRGQPHRQVAHQVFQLVPLRARNHKHGSAGIASKALQDALGGRVHTRAPLDLVVAPPRVRTLNQRGGERAVVTDDEQPPLGASVRVDGVVVWQRHGERGGAQLCLHMRVVELADEGVCPRLCGVRHHVCEAVPVSLLTLLLGHCQRLFDAVAHVCYVPRIDQDGARTKALRGARKLAQH